MNKVKKNTRLMGPANTEGKDFFQMMHPAFFPRPTLKEKIRISDKPVLTHQPKNAERIVPALVKYMKTAQLQPGDKLPSQKELCQILEIGPTLLREALNMLQTLGMVQSHQGSGWYVGRFDPIASLHFLAPLLEDFSHTNPELIIDIRIALEPVFARETAKHIGAEGLQRLESIMQYMKLAKLEKNYEDYKLADKEFHAVLALESQTGFLCLLGSILNDLFFSFWTPYCQDWDGPIAEHEEIVSAMKEGNAERVEMVMKDHISKARYYLQELQEYLKKQKLKEQAEKEVKESLE